MSNSHSIPRGRMFIIGFLTGIGIVVFLRLFGKKNESHHPIHRKQTEQVRWEPNVEQASLVVDPLPSNRPLEITVFGVIFLVLGLLYLIGAFILLAYGDDPGGLAQPIFVYVVKGILLLVAGAGLWRMNPWAVLSFTMFIVVRQALRFQSEVLAGDALDVTSYILFCTGNALFGHYLWRLVTGHSAHLRGRDPKPKKI